MRESAPDATPQQPGSFLGNVNIVLVTYALDGALAFASGVLVARALGADGRGAYALFVITAVLAQMLLGLGLGNAAIYYLNRGEMTLRDVLGALHVVTLAALAVAAAFAAVAAPIVSDGVFGEGVTPWLFVAAVPALIYASVLRLVLQALNRFADMGIATLTQPLVMLTLVATAYAAGDPSASLIVGFWVASHLASAAFSLLRLGLRNVEPARLVGSAWGHARRLAGFGVQGEAGNVLQLLNYRFDQYVIRGFVGLAGVGIYAVGVSMTEAVWLIANAVAIVLLPRLTAAEDDEVRWMTPLACRNTMLVAGAGAIALGVVAPWLLPAFFGGEFERSVQALWWLLPGTVALTGSKVLTSYIFSQGRPLFNTLITASSLVVTLAALFVLVPLFGVNGAAAASSLAYVAHLLAALFVYRRMSGQSALGAVLPRPADARLYVGAVRGVLTRTGVRAVEAPAPTARS